MNIPLSPEMEEALAARAAERRVSVEELVRQAAQWYLQIDPGLLDEPDAWQEVRHEALGRLDGPDLARLQAPATQLQRLP